MSRPTRPLRRERHTSAVERVEAARDEREQLRGDEREQLRDEARYRRERLELYKARLYAGRARRRDKLLELQRASDGAFARLRRAEAQASAPRPQPDRHEPLSTKSSDNQSRNGEQAVRHREPWSASR